MGFGRPRAGRSAVVGARHEQPRPSAEERGLMKRTSAEDAKEAEGGSTFVGTAPAEAESACRFGRG